MKRIFTFEIEYYKTSGKFYTESHFNLEVDMIGTAPYMAAAFDFIRGLRDRGEKMPGLSCCWTKDAGVIRVNHVNGYPGLII